MLPKKILFCTDFSENSEPAHEIAVDYAKAFGAELLIIHVVDSSGFPNDADWMMPSMLEKFDRFLLQAKESAEARLESLARECDQSGKEVKTFCRIGLPAKEIVSLAVKESADLIVTGTHGRTGVKHLVMGSIARSVLKTAHRPVLIVEGSREKGELFEDPKL